MVVLVCSQKELESVRTHMKGQVTVLKDVVVNPSVAQAGKDAVASVLKDYTNFVVGSSDKERLQCQELVERVLSSYADRLYDGGSSEWPEIESLSEDMMVSDDELVTLFQKLGFHAEP